MNKKAVGITELVLRDGNQSLLATRMRIEDILPICEKLDRVGYWSAEVWGGATFDVCIRYLGEDPWERLRLIRKAMPNTPLQMLLRGQNILWVQTLRRRRRRELCRTRCSKRYRHFSHIRRDERPSKHRVCRTRDAPRPQTCARKQPFLAMNCSQHVLDARLPPEPVGQALRTVERRRLLIRLR